MKEIILTRGKAAIVDDKNYDRIAKYKWFAMKHRNTFYGRRMLPSHNRSKDAILIHHEIMGKPPAGFIWDHKDGNGLNNTEDNLRLVTCRQNSQNKVNIKKTSKYPGVYWCKAAGKWQAQITINGKNNYLGRFPIEDDAGAAYRAAVERLGETIIQGVCHA